MFIEFDDLPRSVIDQLARRRLIPVDAEWETHGPHGVDFDYTVFIGPVKDNAGNEFEVAIYPRSVYCITSNWWNVNEADRIFVNR
jgi:hypothetical protein